MLAKREAVEFRVRVKQAARDAQGRFLAGDADGLRDKVRAFQQLADEAVTESDARGYFSGYLQMRCLLAELAADEQRWDDWADHCRSAWLLLGEEVEKRHELGWPYAPYIRARAALYAVTADGLWKAPAEFERGVVSLNRLRQQVLKNARAFFSARDPLADGDLRTLEEISWGALHTHKALLRFGHPGRAEFARALRREFGLLLEDKASPLYWDWQIFEAFVAGRLTMQRFRELNASRRQAVRRLRGADYNLAAYDAATRREQELLLGRAASHLEVLGVRAC